VHILDPRTTLIFATLLILLLGGMLGLMHRRLTPDIQPSAKDWRIGTLLTAGGSVLLAFQQGLPAGFILPVANAFALGGLALYWRAVRRFFGRPDRGWLFLPVALAVLVVFWFSAVTPNLSVRVVVASLAGAVLILGAGWELVRQRVSGTQTSRAILAGCLFVTGGFFLFRALYTLFTLPMSATTILDARHWLAAITPLMIVSLPTVGTAAFLLLCLEHIRAQWERAAATDYLTALPNRRSIADAGHTRFNDARRHRRGFAVALVDIDHFKAINDRHGHDAGDRALRHIAAVLEATCRGPHMAGRHGGEEFVALLEGVGLPGAQAAAERIRHAIESAPLTVDGHTIVITASVGVGVLAPEDREFDDMLRRADKAVYAAKHAGRNRVVVADAPHASPAAPAFP
jgi:diguanylate cyclase (GGDEF)-like protein